MMRLVGCLVFALGGCALPEKGEVFDPDGDGSSWGEDCDNARGDVYPGAAELWYDGVDNDCSAATRDGDADGDGYDAAAVGGADCDDAFATVNPTASDVVGDGRDQNCDGVDGTDSDGDGYASIASGGADCADADAAIAPSATEACDGVDNDCDSETDEAEAVDAPTWHRDVDGDGYGVSTHTMRACAAPSGYAASAGDCDDADADRWPGAPELCGDGVVNACGGSVAAAIDACAVSGEMSLSLAYARLVGDDAYDDVGRSVAGGQDLTGDGLPDIAVGAPGDDDSNPDAGAALVLGQSQVGAGGQSAIEVVGERLYGTANGCSAGYSVALVGDLSGDGLGEVLIGAPDCSDSAGMVYLVSGASGGALDDRSFVRIFGANASDNMGRAVADAGDTDGLGTSGVLLSAIGDDDAGGPSAGSVYLFRSPISGDYASYDADARLDGEVAYDQAGFALHGASDLNGDGVDDVLVGADGYGVSGIAWGAAYVVLGPLQGASSLRDADLKLVGDLPDGSTGGSVCAADVDGDSIADAVIGVPADDAGGIAAVVVSSPIADGPVTMLLSDIPLQIHTDDTQDSAGHAVASAGDVDADGREDLLIGGSTDDTAGHHGGAAWLIYGPLTQSMGLSNVGAKFIAETEGDLVGFDVAGVGDFNGDGGDDLLLSGLNWGDDQNAEGAVYLVLGSAI